MHQSHDVRVVVEAVGRSVQSLEKLHSKVRDAADHLLSVLCKKKLRSGEEVHQTEVQEVIEAEGKRKSDAGDDEQCVTKRGKTSTN